MSEILNLREVFYRLVKCFISQLWNMPVFVFIIMCIHIIYNEGQSPVQIY